MDTSLYDAINNNFIDAFESSKEFLGLGAFVSAARAIGMLGATIYIFSRIWGPILRAEPINFFPLMRPFILLIAIIGSNAICNSMDLIYEDINRISALDKHMTDARFKIDQAIIKREKDSHRIRQELEKARVERYVASQQEADGTVKVKSDSGWGIGSMLSAMFDDMIDEIQEVTVRMMVYLFDALGVLGYFVITLFSRFLIVILQFVAPLAFAFAIYDGFANNATEWFAKYINALLMLIMCKAYTIFTYYLQLPFIENSMFWTSGQTALYLVVILVSIVGYFFVPTMANMALSVGGTGPSASMAGQRTVAVKTLAVNTATAPVKMLSALK